MKRTIIYDDWNLHVVGPETEGCCGSCRHFENEDADGIGTCAAHLHDGTCSEYVCIGIDLGIGYEAEESPSETPYYGDDDSRPE